MLDLDLDLTAKILVWIIAGGGSGALAFVLWNKVEKYFPVTQALTGELKRWIVLIVGAVLAVLAFLCLAWFGLVTLPITPQLWANTIVALIGMSYVASQQLHARLRLTNRNKKKDPTQLLLNALVAEDAGGLQLNWTEIYRNEMAVFYDYQYPELTIPTGSVPLWEHDKVSGRLDRPEYDRRLPPHTYESESAAGLFSMYTTMEAALVFEVDCQPGDVIRANVTSNGIIDQQNPQMALRLGLATEDPGAGAIEVDSGNGGKFTGALESRAVWGVWSSDFRKDFWDRLWTPIVTATRDKVWVVCLARKDFAQPGHSHWDRLVVEVRVGDDPPPNNKHRIRTIVFFDDETIVDEMIECPCGGTVDERVCALAEEIVSLTSPST